MSFNLFTLKIIVGHTTELNYQYLFFLEMENVCPQMLLCACEGSAHGQGCENNRMEEISENFADFLLEA